MKKIKLLLSITLFSVFTQSANSQTTELKLFQSLCNNIAKQNRDFAIVNALEGTMLLADPVSGKSVVVYGKESKDLSNFKKNDISKQIEMLTALELPIFPLKDTVYIIDTLFSFSSIEYKIGRIIFKIERKPIENNNISIFHLENIWLREDEYHLTLFNPGWRNKLDYSFKIANGNFLATRFRRLPPKFEFE